ncbi:hypothetical protein E4T46_09973, partial [Aureobasidium subglaciale]
TAKQRKDATTKFADKKNPIRILVIVARTEAKQLPIIAGAARLIAEQHKVKQLMRNEEIPEKDWQLKYLSYKSQVIHEKAARIYRMLIGSRADHLSWDNFNVDLVDFLPGGQFEN